MGLKNRHRLFFAIPYDTATRQLYEGMADDLRKETEGLECVVGNKEIGPSPGYSDIASFKAQNTELFHQFVNEIRLADIVIADLTNNNPNVHVELGLALSFNKNILRVTGRPLTELGFDIRNFETAPYAATHELKKRISDYLKTYIRIKNLALDHSSTSLYKEYPAETTWPPVGEVPLGLSLLPTEVPVMKDGAIQFDFEIFDEVSDTDWVGVFLRAGEIPVARSCLVYFRRNGWVEIAQYPGQIILENAKKKFFPNGFVGKKTALIELEGTHIRVRIDEQELLFDRLTVEAAGATYVATIHSRVRFENVKVVSRDTINPLY